MKTSVRSPGYDLFKLIVAILLLILFLFLYWRGTPPSPAFVPVLTGTPSITPTIATVITLPQVSATAVPIFSPAATGTLLPSPSPTVIPQISPTSTPIPSATATTEIKSTTTPVAGIPSSSNACEAAISRSRLQVGRNAVLVRRLNFRSSPGIHNNWLLTNKPGTKVEIVDGPVCLPYFVGAYMWWQIKIPDGRIGWSAEASLRGKFYFMEPGP